MTGVKKIQCNLLAEILEQGKKCFERQSSLI